MVGQSNYFVFKDFSNIQLNDNETNILFYCFAGKRQL